MNRSKPDRHVVGYAPDEAFSVEDRGGEDVFRFDIGDILRPVRRNGCGMGIDVIRSDGAIDMVWPEEVEIAR
jgi:hypothetical protein